MDMVLQRVRQLAGYGCSESVSIERESAAVAAELLGRDRLDACLLLREAVERYRAGDCLGWRYEVFALARLLERGVSEWNAP